VTKTEETLLILYPSLSLHLTFNKWLHSCAITDREVHFNSSTEKPSNLRFKSSWWWKNTQMPTRQWAP